MLIKSMCVFRDAIIWTTMICLFCIAYLQTSESKWTDFGDQDVAVIEASVEVDTTSPCMGQCELEGILCGSSCGTLVHATHTSLIRSYWYANWAKVILTLNGRLVGVDPGPPR